MNNTLKNPYESTSALIEGRDIKDIDITGVSNIMHNLDDVIIGTAQVVDGMDMYVPKDKCYLQLAEMAKMDVTTLTGCRKIATFLPGITPVGLKIIHRTGSALHNFTVIE